MTHKGWMKTLETLFPVMALYGILPKYLRGLVQVADLFSPKIRNGIPGMHNLGLASIDCVAKRFEQLRLSKPTRQDMLPKAFFIYEADKNDGKRPVDRKRPSKTSTSKS